MAFDQAIHGFRLPPHNLEEGLTGILQPLP